MVDNQFYGWFDDPPQEKPSYDPPYNSPCPFCGKKMTLDDIRTHSIMYQGQYAARSYFYRTHRTCDDKRGPSGKIDEFIFMMIERNGD